MTKALKHLDEIGGVQKVERKVGDLKRSREKAIITWQAPEVHKQLSLLAADLGTTRQKLIADALNMLFLKPDRAPIA